MSELVQMRQRMKAVETIKKITHAMCLISMSCMARLKSRLEGIHEYLLALKDLQERINNHQSTPQDQFLHAKDLEHDDTKNTTHKSDRTLIVIIGAQKGLCGSYNNQLISYAHNKHQLHHLVKEDLIIIGKKTIDTLGSIAISPLKTFDNFSQSTYEAIAQEICTILFNNHQSPDDVFLRYKALTIISMHSVSFFVHKGRTTHLNLHHHDTLPDDLVDIEQEDPIDKDLERNITYATLITLLIESLVTEQAARFIAMDGSTRNASNLLDTMKLNYNKLRQARITRELTDLAGSF